MSTVLMIRVHEQPGGQLCRFMPKLRGDETEVRKLSVYRELHDWIYAEAEASDVTMEAKGHVRGHLGQFVRGELNRRLLFHETCGRSAISDGNVFARHLGD